MRSKEELGKFLGAAEGACRRRPSRVNWQAFSAQEPSQASQVVQRFVVPTRSGVLVLEIPFGEQLPEVGDIWD